jgi:membrane associated rhomboid family serine protease
MENLSLTLLLVIIIGFISWQGFNKDQVKARLLFHPYAIKHHGEWVRFITHAFIHADWNHLLINLFVLYQFGEVAERFFSYLFGAEYASLVFVLFFLGAVIFSSIPDYFKHQDNPSYGSLGASGATSDLVFIYIVQDPWNWFLFPPLPALFLGIAYLYYSSYMDKKGGDNIGHNAHFWGATFGLAFAVISASILKPEFFQYFISKLMEGPSWPTFLQ